MKIKGYLCHMMQRKKNTAYFLLILYLIVLVHNSIAHNYDCEIFTTLFSHSDRENYNNQNEVEFSKSSCHINVFSNDINVDVRKATTIIDVVFLAIISFSPLCPDNIVRKCHIFILRYTPQSCITLFLLRSPPLV